MALLTSNALPNIRVNDSLPPGEEEINNLPLPSPTTSDDGQPPRSATSSEGNNPAYARRNAAVKLALDATNKETSMTTRPEYSIDPLSHVGAPRKDHILKRNNTENTIPLKLQRPSAQPESKNNIDIETPTIITEAGLPRRSTVQDSVRTETSQNKDKKKGVSVSFLSRFNIIGSKKSDQFEEADGDESELGDRRTEGMNAHVFSSSIGAIGYIPQHKDPSYIKVKAHNKKEREFNRMFLAQELKGNDRSIPPNGAGDASAHKKNKDHSTVWSTEFSRDGRYMAAAGHDHIVRVWAVISTQEERRKHENEEDACNNSSGGQGERLSAPVFRSKPIREFEGHTSTVLDLSWSKNNFLLSSSMDKTVRLWHISRQECLCTFKHKDFVTSIAFHPKDDRFFLAGSLDSVLRLWSIPDKSVAFWNTLPGLITAVAFTPDGKTAMAGIITGLCLFYETEGLKYHTQIHVRSSRGRNAKGSKITGIRTMTYPPDDPDGDLKILITTNDSRVRLYNFRDKSLEMKFKGNSNTCSQINASFSDDGKYVICGSEDKRAYVWSTSAVDPEMKDKRPYEDFGAHQEIVTTAIFAPVKTRQLLSASGDPLYDLCNPPPVTLLSREESHTKPPPSELENPEPFKKQEETPAYIARSLHLDGNIIVTADFTGNIKVFRQDCAFHKRRNDQWETASTFSKKIGAGMMGRSSSIRTKNSDRSHIHSRRNSVTTQQNSTYPSESRILSWRNSVGSNVSMNSSMRNGVVGNLGTNGYINPSARSERSVSPGKFSTGATALAGSKTSVHSQIPGGGGSSAKEARQLPYGNGTIGNGRGTPSIATKSTRSNSPPPTRGSNGLASSINSKNKDVARDGGKKTATVTESAATTPQQLPTPSFSINRASTMLMDSPKAPAPISSEDESDRNASQNSLRLDPTGKSYSFWNKSTWSRPLANSNSNSTAGRPEASGGLLGTGILGLGLGGNRLEKTRSAVSQLSSDDNDSNIGSNVTGVSSSEDVGGKVKGAAEVDEEVKCRRCGGKDFRARKVIANPAGGTGQKLVCGRCGLICA